MASDAQSNDWSNHSSSLPPSETAQQPPASHYDAIQPSAVLAAKHDSQDGLREVTPVHDLADSPFVQLPQSSSGLQLSVSSKWEVPSSNPSPLARRSTDTSRATIPLSQLFSQVAIPPVAPQLQSYQLNSDHDEIVAWRWGIEEQHVAQLKVKRKGERDEDARWEFEQYLSDPHDMVTDFSQRSDLPQHRVVNDLSLECAKEIVLAKLEQDKTRPVEDDPHADWREFGDPNTEEEVSEVEEILTDSDYDWEEADDELLQGLTPKYELDCGAKSTNLPALPQFHVDAVHIICESTSTENAITSVVKGLVAALAYLDDESITGRFQQEKEHKWVNRVLYVVIWLFVCHRMRIGGRPRRNSLTITCGALFKTASMLLASSFQEDFRRDVREFEKQFLDGPFLSQSWYTEIPVTDEEYESQLDDDAKEYRAKLTEEGLVTFVETVMKKESEGPKTALRQLLTRSAMADWARSEMVRMFGSVDRSLLLSCITRRLSQDSRKKGHPTRAALKANARVASVFPCQYINILCDRSGTPPTALQCYAVFSDIAKYLGQGPESDELAERIDSAIAPSSKWLPRWAKRGWRRYPDWRQIVVNQQTIKDEGRRNIIRYFLREAAIDIEADFATGRQGSPRPFSWVEIGFSNKPQRRLREHAHHVNSNYLMNLVHAAFQVRFPGLFILQQEILLPCFAAGHAWLGEIGFSQVCNGYTRKGAGFSHYPAGFSNGSSYRRRTDRQWDPLLLDVVKETPLKANLEQEERQLSSIRQANEQELLDQNIEVASLDRLQSHVSTLELLRQMTHRALEIARVEKELAEIDSNCSIIEDNIDEARAGV